MVEFFVLGPPVPQGSKKAYVVNGRSVLVEAAGARHKDWRLNVRAVAIQAMGGVAPFTGPVRIDIDFIMPRPKSHKSSKGALKANAPRWHTFKPDRDKLERAILDALSGVVYVDDSQVCDGRISKTYGEVPGAHITVGEIVEE
jgi:Holliday junction resolvase RusA-like endonuclease